MVTKREFLISNGLAKEGRGKFSAEAHAFAKKAEEAGMVFDLTPAEIAKLERASRPKKQKKPRPPAPYVFNRSVLKMTGAYDPKAVRKWAIETGREVSSRGKISNALIEAYLKETKPVAIIPRQKPVPEKKPVVREQSPVVTVRKSVARPVVRTETVGYTFIRRGPKDAAFISEPLVAVDSCGYCSKGISYCGCKSGPVAPKYLGGEVLLLTRPSK